MALTFDFGLVLLRNFVPRVARREGEITSIGQRKCVRARFQWNARVKVGKLIHIAAKSSTFHVVLIP